MARQKKPSPDIPEPDETVIEGTAEHLDDRGNDAAADADSLKQTSSPGKTSLVRVLIGFVLFLHCWLEHWH